MSYKIQRTSAFEKELKHLAKKYISIKKDFSDFLDSLNTNPFLGAPIGNNCYKVRMAISSKGKGKSGGARIITCIFVQNDIIVLVSIYDKSAQSTISDEEIKLRLKAFKQ